LRQTKQRNVGAIAAFFAILVVSLAIAGYYQFVFSPGTRSTTSFGASSVSRSSLLTQSSSSYSNLESNSSAIASVSSPPYTTVSSTRTSPVEPGPEWEGYFVDVRIPEGASANQGVSGYAPDVVRAYIAINNTIRWTNDDAVPHTVTFTSVPTGVPAIASGDIEPGATFTYTFTVTGTYQYHCSYHPWMNGSVVLVGELNPFA
jgi:plastocyanin